MLRAIGKGHDNELFVLLVDLYELPGRLEPLLRAVKVALARHHQVILICPWPADVPPPEKDEPKEWQVAGDVQSLLRQTTARRLHRAYHEVRAQFHRIGGLVLCARGGDPVRLVLDRLNRLRSAGLGRR